MTDARRACRGKVRYASAAEGLPELCRLRAQPHEVVAENRLHARCLGVYECPFCRGYHIGHRRAKPAWVLDSAQRLEAAFTRILTLDLPPERRVRKLVGAVVATLLFVLSARRR